LYFLSLSVVGIGAVVAKLGIDNATLRLVASSAAVGDWGTVRAVYTFSMWATGAASFAASLVVFIAAPLIADMVFRKPAVAGPLRAMSFAIFTFSLMTLLSESLKGLQRITSSMLVAGAIYPFVAIVALVPLVSGKGPNGASLAYLLGTGVAALSGGFIWHLAMLGRTGTDRFDRTHLISSAHPLWLMSIINRVAIPWLSIFLLGVWGSAAESGIFGAATRLSMIVTLFLTSVNAVIAPKFAELHAKGDMAEMARVARQFALILALATSPLFLILTFAGDWVMGMFGSEFAAGGTALAILAVGQAIATVTGSVGYLLIITGHERDTRNGAILALLVLVVLATAIMPFYGLIGAAVASAAAIVASNIWSVIIAHRRLGFSPVGGTPFARKGPHK
jgi:O-antigen/teichoic acid export membrane protein